jgi:hypothetical protein
MAKNLIQSSFGQQNRNFEVVFRNAQGKLEHWVRPNDNPPFRWNSGGTFGIAGTPYGNPALIQSNYGQKNRNFEVVVNTIGGGLEHWYRNGDNPPYHWNRGGVFGNPRTSYGDPALIQSNYGQKNRNFEVVVNIGEGVLEHWSRENDNPPFQWRQRRSFGTPGTSYGNPALIQSSSGQKDNFEVVVGKGSGGLEHWWRDNDDPDLPWILSSTFRAPGNYAYGDPALIQSSFGGNFEVVVNIGGGVLEHWYSPPAAPWVKTKNFASNVFASPALIQSSFPGGNFEVVFKDTGGRWWHWYRNNTDSAQEWRKTETIA